MLGVKPNQDQQKYKKKQVLVHFRNLYMKFRIKQTQSRRFNYRQY